MQQQLNITFHPNSTHKEKMGRSASQVLCPSLVHFNYKKSRLLEVEVASCKEILIGLLMF